MKRLLLLITVLQGYSQNQGISYQAVILNPEAEQIPGVDVQNNILANTSVGIQFTITDASGNEEYQESHSTSTGRYGMINLLIGSGNSSYSSFLDIVWGGAVKKLKVAIDFKGGTNYSPLSEQNLTYMPQPVNAQTQQLITDNTLSIAINTAKVGLTSSQTTAITANTAKTGITSGQSDAITANTAKTVITSGQSDAIKTNTAKAGITSGQSDAITANTAKTGITSGQTSAIKTNTAKAGITSSQSDAITANTAKTGVTSGQSDAITANTAKTGITSGQTSAIKTNTAKTGITSGQSDAITANTAKTVITSDQSDAITANTAKTGITSSQSDAITANTAKVGVTSYSIGDDAQGGVVFWVDATGQHGLVVAKTNQSTGLRWYAGTNGSTQAKGDGIYAGKANTSIIIAAQIAIGDNGATYAARLCNELQITESGITYGDWYLPSKFELNQLYLNQNTLNKVSGFFPLSMVYPSYYWSSTESSNNTAWIKNFTRGGDSMESPKSVTGNVRAVRAF